MKSKPKLEIELLEIQYKKLYRAMISKNAKVLNEILSESFVLVHMTGMQQNKKEFISSVCDGTLKYYSEKTESVSVSANDDAIKLIGKSKVNAAVFGAGRHDWNLCLEIEFHSENGKWLMTSAKASSY